LAQPTVSHQMKILAEAGLVAMRSVVAQLMGDREAATRIELVLPETGVCSTDDGASCAVMLF
jgi:hypothetical protein